MKKILSCILSIALFVCGINVYAENFDYTDTQNHWAKKAIEKWSDYEIVQGYNGEFRPNDEITRGEFAVIVDRIMKYQKTSARSFDDLDDNFYTESILKLNNVGVMDGYENKIRPNAPITRQEASVVLCKAFHILGTNKCATKFTDENLIDSWAKQYVFALANNEYIVGYDGTVNPNKNITRAEAVQIVDNIVGTLINKQGKYTNDVNKLCVINVSDISLSDCNVKGNVIVTQGVGNGTVTLKNVNIDGTLIVNSDENSTVSINNCSIVGIQSLFPTVIKYEKEEVVSTPTPITTLNPTVTPTQLPIEEEDGGWTDWGVTTTPTPAQIVTDLEDNIIQKGSKRSFYVMSQDTEGNEIECSVTFNGEEIDPIWSDDEKTSYTLEFINAGENIVNIITPTSTSSFKITYEPSEYGEVIGKAVVSVEAFTVGGGYIVEPQFVDVKDGVNAAYVIDELLTEQNLDYNYSGSLDGGFYISKISTEFNPAIPDALKSKLEEDGYSVISSSNGLGEFDFTQGSGWMYCVNGTFSNLGISDYYLQDGDVLRLQFTLAYGADIGGKSSRGGDFEDFYFEVVNRDELTKIIAENGVDNFSDYMDIITKVNLSSLELNTLLNDIRK